MRVSLAAVALALSQVDAARFAANTTRAQCGSKGFSSQIVNGQKAEQCEWKWQVGFRQSNLINSQSFCGGTIVSPEWVMSAAHCATAPDFWVIAGEYDIRTTTGDEQVRKAVQIFRHPDYNPSTSENDYMLVKVDQPFEFGDCVGAACLPTGDDVAPGTECWISGWGTLSAGGTQPNVMMEGKVNILSNNDCMSKNDYDWGDITKSMVCANRVKNNGEVVDACQGDSGGPLVCASGGTYTLYGATSWGRGCAGKTLPGIWARIHYVMDWVDDVMSGNVEPPVSGCPAYARYPDPDMDGDCVCPTYKSTCYSSNGKVKGCPSSGGFGAYKSWFASKCTTCICK